MDSHDKLRYCTLGEHTPEDLRHFKCHRLQICFQLRNGTVHYRDIKREMNKNL